MRVVVRKLVCGSEHGSTCDTPAVDNELCNRVGMLEQMCVT
jgi:hypothetical protein